MKTLDLDSELFDEYSELDEYQYADTDLEFAEEYDELDTLSGESEWEEEARRRLFPRPMRGPARSRPQRPRPVRLREPSKVRPKRPIIRPRRRPAVLVEEPSSPCICPTHGTEFIRWVQSSLNQVLGLRLPVDGVMDAETRNAVRRFQEQQGLPADGIAGPETEQALIKAKTGQSAQTEEPPEASEFEAFDEETDQFDEMESESDAFRWPRRRTFNPPPAKTIPSGPFQTGTGLCSVIEQDLQDLIVSIGPFNRSVELLYKLTKQKPRNQAQIDDTAKQAKRQMTNLKINLEKMRDRTKKGSYLRSGCTQKDIAKVTCKVRNLHGAWRRIASIETLRDQLVYWLRRSRGSFAKVSCGRLETWSVKENTDEICAEF